MRVPVGVNLESRDGETDRDAKVVNGIIEKSGEQTSVRKRPGLADMGLVKAGTGQLLMVWNGVRVIAGDYMNSGTITTITSGPTQSNLSPTNAGLDFHAVSSSNNAATPRLFFKNRSQAWTMNRAGTIAAVTFGGNMGGGTYPLISITRVGTTATATMSEDVFGIGDAITVAGASDALYNVAPGTVTAVTLGSYTPAEDIPITITRSGTTATATTVSGSAHGLTTATAYTIAGANDSAYNGSKTITTSGGTTFTYTVTVTAGTTSTWNSSDKTANITLSGGSLTATGAIAYTAYGGARGTHGKSSGKWYFEVNVTTALNQCLVGVGATLATEPLNSSTYGVSVYPTSTLVGIALDMDSGKYYQWNGATLTLISSGLSGTYYPTVTAFGVNSSGSGACTAVFNDGTSAFTYSLPSGYSAFNATIPVTPATGTITVAKPAVTVNPTFTYTMAGTPAASPASGTLTVQGNKGMVPGAAYLNGYFFVMDYSGIIWNSASDNPTSWGALDFIAADDESGEARAIARSGNYILALKEWSTEAFYDAQNPTGSPLSPVGSGASRIGCAIRNSVAECDGVTIWVSQTRATQGFSVHMQDGLQFQKISTPDIDRVLSTVATGGVYAFNLKIEGHSLYVLTLIYYPSGDSKTLVYDMGSQSWSEWSGLTIGSSAGVDSITRDGDTATITTTAAHSIADGAPVKVSGANQNEYNGIFQAQYVSARVFTIQVTGDPLTPATGTILHYPYTEASFPFVKASTYGAGLAQEVVTLLLHRTDGHLYQMASDLSRDAGAPINTFFRTARMDGGTNQPKKLARARVIADSETGTCMIRWSDDDCSSYSKYRIVDLSSERPEVRRCGAFRRRTVEIRHVADTPLRVSGLELEIEK